MVKGVEWTLESEYSLAENRGKSFRRPGILRPRTAGDRTTSPAGGVRSGRSVTNLSFHSRRLPENEPNNDEEIGGDTDEADEGMLVYPEASNQLVNMLQVCAQRVANCSTYVS